MNCILTASTFLFPLITFPYVSRILLPVGTGSVAFATSIVSYFSMVAMMGVPTYGIRACAQVRDDKEKLTRTVQEILIINLVMTLIVYVLFAIALVIVPQFKQDRLLLSICSFSILFNIIGIEWLYKALEQYTYITARSVLFKIISLILVFLLIHKQDDYIIYGAITVFAVVGSNVLNLINARHYIDIKPVGNYNFKRHLKPIGIFFAMSAATTIYTNLDTVMLGFFKDKEIVGLYSAAVRIKELLLGIVTSLGAVLLPRVSYYAEKGLRDKLVNIAGKALNFVFMFACPLIIYFVFMAKDSILFLSGPAYIGSVLPMQIILITLLLIGITNILGIQMLVPLNKEKYVLYSECIGAVINITFNSLLIPRFAAAGAAIGTVLAESAVLLVQIVVLKDVIPQLIKGISWWPIGGALFSAGIALFLVNHLVMNSNPFIRLAITGIPFLGIYGAMLLLLKEPLILSLVSPILKKTKM